MHLSGILRTALAAILFTAVGISPCQNATANQVSYEGTLGAARIGLTVVVKGGNTIVAATTSTPNTSLTSRLPGPCSLAP